MRLDHLLSKEEKLFSGWSNPTKGEERSKELLSIVQGSREEKSRGQGIKGEHVHLTRLKKTSPSAVNNLSSRLENTSPRT